MQMRATWLTYQIDHVRSGKRPDPGSSVARAHADVPAKGNTCAWSSRSLKINPLTPKFKNTFYQTFKGECISKPVRIGSIFIFHLSELWKTTLFVLCDVIFLVRLQGRFKIDHSWEWKFKRDLAVMWIQTIALMREECELLRPEAHYLITVGKSSAVYTIMVPNEIVTKNLAVIAMKTVPA